MVKRKLAIEEFALIFSCYLTLHREGYDEDEEPYDEWERMVVELVKQEALDAIAFWERDKDAKKVKREFFKTNFMTAKGFSDGGQRAKAREYSKKAFMDGYKYYYGEDFMKFLEEEALPLLAFIGATRLPVFVMGSENEFKLQATMNGAKERLMMMDGLKV